MTEPGTWILISTQLIVACGVVGALFFAYHRGLGPRTIQFTAIIVLGPILMALGLERALSGETLAAVFGTYIGFIVSVASKISSKDSD